ncbi:MAG: ABC transporter ATP-binding protein [bacterium]
MALLKARGLWKNFGEVQAVAGIDLEIDPGEIFGLVGPDGAGKTTTLRLLVGVLDPERGDVEVDGVRVDSSPEEARERLGYMPQQYSLYGDLTVAENLAFFADMYFVPKAERKERLARLYRFSRLESYANRPAGKLSGGMYKKLALSCNMIHGPKVLLLDEPTTGVDPLSRRELWDILYAFAAEGVAIVVCTPYMDEAERCHRVGLMAGGRFLAMDRPQAILEDYPEAIFEAFVSEIRAARAALRTVRGVLRSYPSGQALKIACAPGTDPAVLGRALAEAGLPAVSLERVRPSFEDVFLSRQSTTEQRQ